MSRLLELLADVADPPDAPWLSEDPTVGLLSPEWTAVPPVGWWSPILSGLSAPFPWFGGKSKAAALIWERLGNPGNYVEPFAGSMAVLLQRPDEPRVETVNDIDGHLCNLWRCMQRCPDRVADAANWPVSELDQHSRHRYLTKIRGKLAARCEADPEFCNPTIAGWWIWGISAWIGSGWCSGEITRQRPDIGSRGGTTDGGRGVHGKKMRRKLPSVGGQTALDGGYRPSYGQGVHSKALRVVLAGGGEGFPGQGPHPYEGKGVNGAGFRKKLPSVGSMRNTAGTGDDGSRGIHTRDRRSALYELFDLLSRRLRYVRVTCGDWRRIMTPSVTWKHGLTGVVLDPPYEGFEALYGGDVGRSKRGKRKPWRLDEVQTFEKLPASNSAELEAAGKGPSISERVRLWCLDEATRGPGAKYLRVALCGYEGEHNELEEHGWTKIAWKAHGGMGNQGGDNVNASLERIWFSPACLASRQASLFEGAL